MAEKKKNKLTDIMPNIILVMVLVCSVLIIFEVSGNLLDEAAAI